MFLAVIFLIQACELHIWRIYSVVCCLLLHSQWLISLPLCNWFWIYFHVHIIWGNPRDFCWRCFCPKRTLGRELRASPLGPCTFPLTTPSWVPGLLCLPPQSCRMNFTEKKLRTWGEGEVSCFIDQISPSVFSGYSGFSKTLMDLVLRWLCILAKTWWVNYCFPKKATLSRRAWKNGGEKPYVWWNLLYVWWCINRMIHKLCFFQECSSKRPISSGKSQQFQCGFKIKMLN